MGGERRGGTTERSRRRGEEVRSGATGGEGGERPAAAGEEGEGRSGAAAGEGGGDLTRRAKRVGEA